jgi:prepilin-type N-terminal cleavage/methylation domain-containing protein
MHAIKQLRMNARTSAIAQSAARANSSARVNGAGFTLIELMVVVAIIGVLATLATYGVRKYVLEAKRSEAVSMLTAIRGAEEAYRDETFVYLGAANFSTWHPTNDPGGKKSGWGSGSNAMSAVFDQLGVVSDGPVEYSYAVIAGNGGTLPAIPMTLAAPFPAPTGPYYIAMGMADLNNDGSFTYAICHSDSNVIQLDDNY